MAVWEQRSWKEGVRLVTVSPLAAWHEIRFFAGSIVCLMRDDMMGAD